MKKLILNFYKKHKKYVIIAGSGLLLIILGLLSWKLVFVRFKIFYDNESKFTKAAERYYEYHKQMLPKKGESKDLTLQDLYDLKQIDDLYIPKSNKMCDVNNSWVRVYMNEDNEYVYYTYLKCGWFQSRVDHEGPKITLNGKTKTSMALNGTYEELGVKSVIDNKDGKIDAKKVTIDSSKVNTSKIGTYPVTYTIKDSHYNKTVITRNVSVAKGLTDTVKANVSEDGYYKGNSNNYVLFSGMLWRIVNVNEDGTVRMILNQAVTNLRMDASEYENSNADIWLNDIFYKALHDADTYITKTKYCVGNINSMLDTNGYCDTSIDSKIGLLDIDGYLKTFIGNESSVFAKSFALGHKIGSNYADATFDDTRPDGTETTILAPIRPVITLKNNLNITAGDGSITKPYKLNDYNYAKKTDKINTRLIGEYVEFSGLTFRIIGTDDDNNVRLIMSDEWKVQPNDTPLFVSTDGLKKWKFDVEDEKNPAYVINNDFLDYIGTKNMVDTTYEIPTNDATKKFNKYKTEKVKAKVVLPKTYELFAGVGSTRYMYLFIDSSTNDQLLFTVNSTNGKVFELGTEDFLSYGIKAIITIKGNLRIESGKGTVNSPYKLK